MRLSYIQYIISNSIHDLELSTETVTGFEANNGRQKFDELKNWLQIHNTLDILDQFDFFEKDISYIMGEDKALRAYQDDVVVNTVVGKRIDDGLEVLIQKCKTILSLPAPSDATEKAIINVRLPEISDASDLSVTVKDLNQALTQCPLFDGTIELKFNGVEYGSSWISFAVASGTILMSLAKFINICLENRKLFYESESIKLDYLKKKTEIKSDVKKQFVEMLEELEQTQKDEKYINLAKEINPEVDLSNENLARFKFSVDTILKLTDRGMEFEASNNASQEVKNVFPQYYSKEMLEQRKVIDKVSEDNDN